MIAPVYTFCEEVTTPICPYTGLGIGFLHASNHLHIPDSKPIDNSCTLAETAQYPYKFDKEDLYPTYLQEGQQACRVRVC